MKRDIFASWLAVVNDFDEKGNVKPDGPTLYLHRFFWQYKSHHIFYTIDKEHLALKMKHFLYKHFPNRKIFFHPLVIDGIFINLAQIKTKIEEILYQYKDQTMDFCLSMGTGVMKIAWYIIHTSKIFKSRLTIIVPPIDKEKPEFIEILIDKSESTYYAIIREKSLSQKSEKDFFISESLEPIYDKAYKLALSDNVSVLILGETGTGKEVLAKYIHQNSPRKQSPFLSINSSAFSDQLLEARLFGYKKGSFTGAVKDTKGLLEEANTGTVFMDEIGDISLYMQQTLLRFLQEKEIQPIGGKPKKVDTRIIAATNKNIIELVNQNKFRSDLYYRLGLTLELPPFRDFKRKEKIEWINFLLKKKKKIFGRKKMLKISSALADFLLNYNFPGNIRELENFIDNFYVFAEQTADLEHLPQYALKKLKKTFPQYTLDELEKRYIDLVLKKTNGKKSQACKILGISYNTLKAKIKKYGLDYE